MACEHYRYRESGERLTPRHGYLVWPTTEEIVEFGADFSVVDQPFVYVQRADDGSSVGKSGVPENRDVETARAAGRTYLAEAGDIVTLPVGPSSPSRAVHGRCPRVWPELLPSGRA